MKRISAAYASALKRHGIKQAAFAAANGLNSPDLSRVAQGQFPSDKILHAFAHGWPDPQTGIEIIEAHLRDECERAGLGKALPRIGNLDTADNLNDDLLAVEKVIQGAPDLRVALRKLAQHIRKSEAQTTPPPQQKPRKVSPKSKARQPSDLAALNK